MALKKRRRWWGWVWTALLVAGGGGVFWYQQQQSLANSQKLPTGVQTGKAELGAIEQKITATGVVAAQIGAKVNIGSQISGRIKRLPADVGSVVRARQVVAEIDSPDLAAQVQQQVQNVEVAQATLVQAESRLQQALLTARLTSDQTREQIREAESALKGSRERLQMSEATAQMQPTQTSSEIARAQAALSTARSHERQVKQTVNLTLQQAQTTIDDARAESENVLALRKRQESLLEKGFISAQEVDDTRTRQKQALSRLENAQAALNITREKTQADLEAARDQVLQAQATLESARSGRFQDTMREAEMRSARQTVAQAEASVALRKTGRTEDSIRKRAVEEARSAVTQSQASLRQAKALLDYQKAQLDKAIIRSPINGTVLSIAAQQGETVAAGFSVQTLITVADLNRLEVRAYVDETDVGRLRLGLPAEVRVESHQDRVFHGRVTKVAAASTLKDNVVTYETTIAIDDANGLLRPDMTADVTLVLGRTANILIVPTEAVHRDVKQSVVYVLHRKKQGKERVETRTITTGAQDGNFTQIATGLGAGEEVVLAGLQRLGVKAVDAQDAEGKKEEK